MSDTHLWPDKILSTNIFIFQVHIYSKEIHGKSRSALNSNTGQRNRTDTTGWKTLAAITLALKPKDLPTFSHSSSFMIYCWCFLLRISGAPHTAQNTQVHPQRVEKYLLCLPRWNISPTSSSFDKLDLTTTKRPSFKVHYLTRKTDDNKKNPAGTSGIFQGLSSSCNTNCTHSWRGQRPQKRHSLLASHLLPNHFRD